MANPTSLLNTSENPNDSDKLMLVTRSEDLYPQTWLAKALNYKQDPAKVIIPERLFVECLNKLLPPYKQIEIREVTSATSICDDIFATYPMLAHGNKII